MTVEVQYTPAREAGNGSKTNFEFDFRIEQDGDLLVYVVDSNGDATLQVLDTDYTVNISTTAEGGSIDYATAPAAGEESLILRAFGYTQPTDIPVVGGVREEQLEKALDRLCILIQQVKEITDRSVKLLSTSSETAPNILDAPSEGKALVYDADGNLVNSTYAPDDMVADATAAKVAAEAAQAAAELAQTAAETAETNAETAETNAEAAQAAAELAAAQFTLASQAEAEAGSDNTKYMTPLRVSQGIAALAPVRATNTVTLTNKRITPRVDTVASSATPTINTDTTDVFTITALAAAITSFTTNLSGTPTTGQKLIIRIKDNGTARAIAWGASFASRGATLPTTTVLSKTTYVGLIWNEVASTWDCIATCTEA